MCVYDQYVGKRIKIVWQDNDRQKAVVGFLTGFDEKFLTVRADKVGNLLSISTAAVVTISEYRGGSQ